MILIIDKFEMKKLAILLLFTLLPVASIAKDDPDFTKPMEFSGDFLSLNLNSRDGEYKGNFVAIQGSMRIEGTHMKLKQKKNGELDMVEILGQPVKFKKRNYQTGELINGSAEKAMYDANKLLITLEGNAEVNSDSGRSFSSNKITYGLTSGEIKAVGNSQRRVKIVIPPNSTRESVSLGN